MSFENILSPINYGGVSLKNRIIFAPTTMGLKDDEYKEEIRRLAKGGCSMIIIGDVPVGKSTFTKAIVKKKGFRFYKELCDIAHEYDCKIAAQLHQDDSDMLGMLKVLPGMLIRKKSANDIRAKLNELTSNYISQMKPKKIEKILDEFGSAAILCKKAGFDCIQVHGDRMCGSFLSPLINKRTDSYGGKLKNRIRFAVESVKRIRYALPDMPIDFKLCIRIEEPHYGTAGITMDEIRGVVPALEEAGVTSFHVALANHSDLNDTIPPKKHPYFKEEGCFLPFADEVKKWSKLPVCGVGCLSTPEFVEESLRSGRIDCAGMCRELICDPEYVNKLMSNQPDSIKLCVRCNKGCLGGVFEHKGVHCIFDIR